ncbi:MAG: hypothetical protein ACXW5U_23245 [Thermoanaerobaculia bacterium]
MLVPTIWRRLVLLAAVALVPVAAVAQTVDLSVSISDSPDPITLGQGDISYTVYYNESTSKATNPFVNITIPAASTFVSAVADSSGTCGSGAIFTACSKAKAA